MSNMMRRFLDSKFMDAVEAIGDIAIGMAQVTTEVLCETFSQGNNNEETTNNKGYDEATYEYFRYLTNDEQQEYFKNNEYLNLYYEDKYIYNNRDQQAKVIAEIAYKMNRSFTNKYDRY